MRGSSGPVQGLLDHGNGTAETKNWSGYAVEGSGFTSAQGSWVVPTANCTGTLLGYAAFWVGLDGYTSSTVEQTGTTSDCIFSIPIYYAWYEFYPNGVVLVDVPVKAGDVISASVVYNATPNNFTVTITDVTSGKSATHTQAVSGAARSSAEWIAEAPATVGDIILPLTNFGTVNFGADSTAVGGTNDAADQSNSGPIGSFLPVNVIQIAKTASFLSPQTASCSTLSNDGTSFSCTWAK